jgi:hypothetical protein
MHVQSLGKNQTIVTVKDNNGHRIECLYSYETPVAVRCVLIIGMKANTLKVNAI